MKKHILNIFILLLPVFILAQTNLKGMIMDQENPEDNLGIAGATVNWLNTNIGTTTNEKGWFTIPFKKEYEKLVISYIGYKSDTIIVKNLTPILFLILFIVLLPTLYFSPIISSTLIAPIPLNIISSISSMIV